MTMTRTDKIVATLLAFCAAIAAVSAFAAKADAETYSNGFQMSKFKVELKGWQKTTFINSDNPADVCDPGNYSSGEEKVTFTSKPIVINATYMAGERNPNFFTGKTLGIPTKAVVTRSYHPWIPGPMPAECGDNGGGVENSTTHYDCGTKTVKGFEVKLEYSAEKRDKLLLVSDSTDDPFDECPGGVFGFPELISYGAHEAEIGADLSQKELFDPQFQKWISLANGVSRIKNAEYGEKTTVHWDVAFTRLKH